ncbi:MAG: pyridoxal phosphate-dependent aminotransferase family protein [SAR324 cluster bacterium]|uniref:Pyridoxal phosphate-dependent aminotransferase family protein n=1 Tax=SAR324 cluster bacterium TaxID=2024889 RepID=A0A7X9FU75_9DELT|nr:pyridoxal phosphate-dependent aminotransferase family protein [SAR324 cluster bacterium]
MIADLKRELARLQAKGRLQDFSPLRDRQGATISYKNKKLVDFTNWDLFDVSSNQTVLNVVHKGLEEWGLGANAPRLSTGTNLQHLAFEKRLASFLGLERSLLFTSRNQAVLSLVTALLNEQCVAFVDELIQSPVADAAYLVNSNIVFFNPEKLEALETELQKIPMNFKKFIFLEGLSPLRGRVPPLVELLELALKYNSELILDESFSIGIFGLRGAGSLELLNSEKMPFCIFASLSYGLSGLGAFVAGASVLCEYLINQSRTFSSEASLPPAYIAGSEAALNFIELSVATRERIARLGLRLKSGLRDLSFKTDEIPCPLICISFERLSFASELAEGLFERGFLVEVLQRGGFLDNGALLRILLGASHTENHVDSLLQAIGDLISLFGNKSTLS